MAWEEEERQPARLFADGSILCSSNASRVHDLRHRLPAIAGSRGPLDVACGFSGNMWRRNDSLSRALNSRRTSELDEVPKHAIDHRMTWSQGPFRRPKGHRIRDRNGLTV
jgi:hypothetical protein